MIEITKSCFKIQNSEDFWPSLQVVLLKNNWPRTVLLFLADDKQVTRGENVWDESHAWTPEYNKNLDVDFFQFFN